MAKQDQWLFEVLSGTPASTSEFENAWNEIGTPTLETARRTIIYARDRCKNPGTKACPTISNLMTVTGVAGIPFEYPNSGSIQRNRTTGLYQVSRDRQLNRRQQFIPTVNSALSLFIQNMQQFGMPIEAILTAGSLYCRCISGTNTLSNHSFGDAIDIVGVRWAANQSSLSRERETIVHNFQDPEQRALLRRINACLRLSFSTVIDYNYNRAHQDHFHCDMNQGKGRILTGKTSMSFLREALMHVLQITISSPTETQKALQKFARDDSSLFAPKNRQRLSSVFDQLFERVARG